MRVGLDLAGLRKIKPWEVAVRFAFGGLVTVATGIVAKSFGPELGGLFLAFPAILPASLTMVKQHDGRKQAVEDARGAQLGALGLVGFSLAVLLLARHLAPWLTLTLATLAWGGLSGLLFALRYGFSHES